MGLYRNYEELKPHRGHRLADVQPRLYRNYEELKHIRVAYVVKLAGPRLYRNYEELKPL